MKLVVEIPDYDGNALDIVSVENCICEVSIFHNAITIRADAAALDGLGKQLLYMAHSDLPKGAHVHYDDFAAGKSQIGYSIGIEKI